MYMMLVNIMISEVEGITLSLLYTHFLYCWYHGAH